MDERRRGRERKKRKKFLRVILLPLSSSLYSCIIALPSAVTLQRVLLSPVGWFGCEIQTWMFTSVSVLNYLFWCKPVMHVSATSLPFHAFLFQKVIFPEWHQLLSVWTLQVGLKKHFGEYACLFSCQELDENIESDVKSVRWTWPRWRLA